MWWFILSEKDFERVAAGEGGSPVACSGGYGLVTGKAEALPPGVTPLGTGETWMDAWKSSGVAPTVGAL